MTEIIIPNSKEKRAAYLAFKKAGAQVSRLPLNDVTFVDTIPYHSWRCGDERYGRDQFGRSLLDLMPAAPACFGAAEGVAAFFELPTWVERFDAAVKWINKLGFHSGVHYDENKGLLGCAFREALIAGKIRTAPPISEEDIFNMHQRSEVYIDFLYGKHTGTGIILNFEAGTTVFPEGKLFVVDVWALRRMGIGLQRIADVTTDVGRLLFQTPNPSVYIPKLD